MEATPGAYKIAQPSDLILWNQTNLVLNGRVTAYWTSDPQERYYHLSHKVMEIKYNHAFKLLSAVHRDTWLTRISSIVYYYYIPWYKSQEEHLTNSYPYKEKLA